MSPILPSQQARELCVLRPADELLTETNALFFSHKSIIAYMSANSLPNTAAALRTESGLGEDVFDTATTKKYETLLEKKWSSIIRLQKKVSLSQPNFLHIMFSWRPLTSIVL